MEADSMKKPDVFDRFMDLGIMTPLRPFYRKYKMPLLYLFFGGLTTVLSIFLFWLFSLKMSPLIANIISWVICVIFAYLTNRTWVFESQAKGLKQIAKECLSFAAGRLATLGMEELMLWIGIDLLHGNKLVVKIIAQIAVVIGNYVISKCLVFRKKDGA